MTIVLYGATGYTGRLVADELARRGLAHVLSGRDPDKLAELADARGAAALPASLSDDASLRALLADASVVINCAGPFTLAGDALVRAAVTTKTHYVDSTGEQPFIKQVFDAHGAAAARAGVALVSGLGFDYAPGDCLARLTAEGLEPLEELVVAYDVEGFGMTRGTLRSALEMLKGGDVVYRDERWEPAPAGISRARFDFGPPAGNRSVSRYPAGEVVTVPHHTRTKAVTALISNSTVAPAGPVAALLPFVMPALSLSLRTPLRGLLSKSIGALPEGPAEEDRRAASFTIVALARALDGRTRRGVLHGSDVYGLTAVGLAEAARLMSAEGYDRKGALPPALAVEPAGFLDVLGLDWSAGSP